MTYLSLARRHRPTRFSDVVGQELAVASIVGGLKKKILPHSMVFSGPRGTGKTTLCRILAKALNCQEPLEGFEPCLKCDSCENIQYGAWGYTEVDGASYNGVDMVRELLSTFSFIPPAPFKVKFYVIDEAHMLSSAAFNAMLKSIEEPPPHVYIALVTTEPNKIPETVMSRCVHFELEAIPTELVIGRLKHVVEKEGLDVSQDVLEQIALLARNSIRDSLTLLDRYFLLKMSGDDKQFLQWLERGKDTRYLNLVASCIEGDLESAINCFRSLVQDMVDSEQVIRTFMTCLTKFLVYFSSSNSELDPRFESTKQKYKNVAVYEIVDITLKLLKYSDFALRSPLKEIVFEAALVKVCSERTSLKSEKLAGSLVSEEKKDTVDPTDPCEKFNLHDQSMAKETPILSETKSVQEDSTRDTDLFKSHLAEKLPSITGFLNMIEIRFSFGDNELNVEFAGGSVGLDLLKRNDRVVKNLLKSLW
ncbi:MAG: DNA polymerase III subunit gamma/tau, partial [Deltaproteobacteria bacterium]|nr:DNA polymerase III subunit gamma/tau [Deltaproteobacteria bacterium]